MEARKVETSDVFNVPLHLVAGWQNLRIKIERGEDLLPHLSRQVRKVGSTDSMLNHWGINHFHLGIEPDSRHPTLIEGTSEIVYASLVGNRFLALTIDDHGKWTDKELLETIGRCWPDHPGLNEGMILATNYTEEDEIALRKAKINVPARLRDGTHFVSLGETQGGSSSVASFRALKTRGAIARSSLTFAKEREAHLLGDAILVAHHDWSLHIEFPILSESVALLTAPGEALSARDVVESWRG